MRFNHFGFKRYGLYAILPKFVTMKTLVRHFKCSSFYYFQVRSNAANYLQKAHVDENTVQAVDTIALTQFCQFVTMKTSITLVAILCFS